MNEIIRLLCNKFGISEADVLSKNRKMPLPQARHYCFATAWTGGFTQQQIALAFGLSQSAISRGITNHFQTNRF
jgi:chromosomal replication initiation ATPase DnaA